MNSDGSNQTRLTYSDLNHDNVFPSWSPDGGKIVFARGAGRFEIDTINLDGTSLVQVTHVPEASSGYYVSDYAPVWSSNLAMLDLPLTSLQD